MTILGTSDLSLSFGEQAVLDGISFAVNAGDHLGVIGVNGAGKTTLFRLLCGELAPDRGNVFIARDATIGMLAQNTAVVSLREDTDLLGYMYGMFAPLLALEREIEELTSALQIAPPDRAEQLSARLEAAHSRYAAEGGLQFRGRCRSMLLHMGFSESELNMSVRALSGGQQTRLALSRLLCREPDILLLDEPTNHLDIDALNWLEDFLRDYKKTVLVISHDRYFLDRVTGKTLLIEHHRARLYGGSYSACREQQAADAAALEKRYREQQKVIARIRANIDFQRRCGQEHNFVTIRAKQKQLDRMERVELAPAAPRDIRLRFSSEESTSEDVLEARGVTFSFGEKPLMTGLDLLVRRGERLLVLGRNGCGKSTLMKLMMGKLVPSSGNIALGYNIKVGYYDQENREFDESKTVFEELRRCYPDKTDFELRSALALFLFGEEEVQRPVSALSGGERARVTLAKLILKKVNLLIMDEPPNHLDIGSREALEAALEAFDGTVIAVSHDRYFINRIATRIIELTPDAPHGCNEYLLSDSEPPYEQYERMRQSRLPAPGQTPPQGGNDRSMSEGRQRYEERKRAQSKQRSEERRRERAQARVGEIEARLSALEQELFGEAATDYLRASELDREKQSLEEELLSLYEILL